MRVLFVTTSFPRFEADHAGSFVFRLAKYLVEAGVDVRVVAPGDHGYPGNESLEGVRVIRKPYFRPRRLQRLAYGHGIPANLRQHWLARLQVPFFFLAMLLGVARELKKVDVVHCHWLPTILLAKCAMVLTWTRRPIVFTNWGSDTRLLPKGLTRMALRLCDAVISTAEETDQHLREAGYDHFHSIMAPVDESRFDRSYDRVRLKESFGVAVDVPIVSFIGRLNYFKDPITFIRACGLLKQGGFRFKSLVAGDGDLRQACESEIKFLALDEEVLLLGMRNDPELILAVSDVTVHISPIENTWANVIAEAMFMNVPVVMTSSGHTEKTFTHEVDCLIVPAGDPQRLAGSVKRIIEDATLSASLVAGARALLAAKGKDRHTIVTRLKAVYASLPR